MKMRNVILLLVVMAALIWIGFIVSAEDKPKSFTGYVVGKTYTPAHMCCSDVKEVNEAAFVPVHVAPHTVHHHRCVDPEFILHVANRHQLIHRNVDTLTYINTPVLKKVTFKL